MSFKSVPIHSFEDFLDRIPQDEVDSNTGVKWSPCVFRGSAKSCYGLEPGIARLGFPIEKLAAVEQTIFDEFRAYAYPELPPSEFAWRHLAIAQHHGLPTRLLDWTFSPTVALHFATFEDPDSPGGVWMLDFVKAKAQLPKDLREKLNKIGTDVFSLEVLQNTFPRCLRDLNSRKREEHFTLLFQPPSLDDRVSRQYALFSLSHPLGSEIESCSDGMLTKFEFSCEVKKTFRKQLDQMNISEHSLMGDLDGLARGLKRWWKSRAPAKAMQSSGGD